MVEQVNDGGIQQQLAQINQELGRQSVQLGIINTKLDGLVSSSSDHETRIRVLETAKAKLYGAAIASGMLSGGVATIIYWALTQTHH